MTDKSILGQFKETFKSSSETLPPRGIIGVHQKALFTFWFFSAVALAYRSFLNGKKHVAGKQFSYFFFLSLCLYANTDMNTNSSAQLDIQKTLNIYYSKIKRKK